MSELPAVLLSHLLSALAALPLESRYSDSARQRAADGAARALLRLSVCSKHLRAAVAAADDVWQARARLGLCSYSLLTCVACAFDCASARALARVAGALRRARLGHLPAQRRAAKGAALRCDWLARAVLHATWQAVRRVRHVDAICLPAHLRHAAPVPALRVRLAALLAAHRGAVGGSVRVHR